MIGVHIRDTAGVSELPTKAIGRLRQLRFHRGEASGDRFYGFMGLAHGREKDDGSMARRHPMGCNSG